MKNQSILLKIFTDNIFNVFLRIIMNVLHISTLDKGGAANVCINLHDQLLVNGYSWNITSLKKTRSIDKLEQYYDQRNPSSFLKNQ
jgi:hypothetical protein